MQDILGVGVLIIIGILAIINFTIYHKIFNIVFYSSMSQFFAEILICIFIGVMEFGLIGGMLGAAFSAIIKIILTLLKIFLILVAVVVVIGVVGLIVQLIKEKSNQEMGSNTEENYVEKVKNIIKEKVKKIENNELICPVCQKTFPINMKFCSSCGTKLEMPEERVSEEKKEGESRSEEIKKDICQKCGKELAKNVNFCTNCGEKVEK